MTNSFGIRITLIAFITAISCAGLSAQGQDYYENVGKIYVVVAVAAVIVIGISGFLFYLDRRIGKLEKRTNNDS